MEICGYDPGLLSGIVLAGANQKDNPEAILTAMEVSELRLEGVDLAVLSACETGLGTSAGGEGVLGLQRSFQVAGARSVVAGLWQVPDDATRKLMSEFYQNLWTRKMSKVEALRAAQIWMLKEGAKRGMTYAKDDAEAQKSQSLPPFYWAGFVLAGDWR